SWRARAAPLAAMPPGRSPREATDQALVYEARGHQHAVANGFRRRPAMADDAESVESDERRPAVLRVIHPLAEPSICLSGQKVADPGAERRRQLVVQQPFDRFDEPFADLEGDVAGETVADDHVRRARVNVAPFDVPYERDWRRLEQLMSLSREIVALALLLPD